MHRRLIADIMILGKTSKTIAQDVNVYKQAECVLGKFIYTERYQKDNNQKKT